MGCLKNFVIFRSVIEAAEKVKNDYMAGKIFNFHPPFVTEKKRKYISDEVIEITREFWEDEATIPEPSYRKVMGESNFENFGSKLISGKSEQ